MKAYRVGSAAFLSIAMILSIASAYGQVTTGSCEGLKNLKIPEINIVAAQSVSAGEFIPPGRGIALGGGQPPFGGKPDIGRGSAATGNAMPAFCRVSGKVQPSINFEIWLPLLSGERKWNGKFNGVGNGGLAGFINYDAMMQAIARGYATASTDTGHVDKMGDDSWALDEKLRIDFASRSIHMTAIAAKTVIKAYYNQDPRYSYFTGCSGGGGQALSEAQRYPADYNGIVAGAPANFPTRLWPGELYAAWVTHRDEASRIPNEKLSLITNAAIEACDESDGIKDGVIEDPRQCNFDPARIQCSGADRPTCLTAAQADSVRKIYEGAKDPSTGRNFWYGYEKSSETQWPGHINNPFNTPISYFKFMVMKDPNWNWRNFSFSDSKNFAFMEDASRKLGPVLDSTNPDLALFAQRGGKMIMYHGWLDQNIAPRNTVQYFESVQKKNGGVRKSDEFVRLFMAPGMAHCGGGSGPNSFDALASLEQWVERDTAPDQIIASHSAAGKVDRTRPLCPYPQVAKYKGSGNTDDAASFVCALPSNKNVK